MQVLSSPLCFYFKLVFSLGADEARTACGNAWDTISTRLIWDKEFLDEGNELILPLLLCVSFLWCSVICHYASWREEVGPVFFC